MEARKASTPEPEVPARKKRQPLRAPLDEGKENADTGIAPKKPRRHDIKVHLTNII